MAEISKINVNGTEYDIRSYVPFASSVATKIGTFQNTSVYQIIVELTEDNIRIGEAIDPTYAEKSIILNANYDILNISGVYEKKESDTSALVATYCPIPDKKDLQVNIVQRPYQGTTLVGDTTITIKCNFWDPDTAKKDTNCAYITLTLIGKTR